MFRASAKGTFGRVSCGTNRYKPRTTEKIQPRRERDERLLDADDCLGFAPELFQIVQRAHLGGKDVDDDISIVHQHPARVGLTFDVQWLADLCQRHQRRHIRDDWTMPARTCTDCGGEMEPVAYLDGDEVELAWTCPNCGEAYDWADDWPFTRRTATAADLRAAGFGVVR